MRPRHYIRNIEINNLLDVFLVSAITAVLLIRFQLYVTGYPQIGVGGLHIAHVLFGGILMMVALILSFSFINRSVRLVIPVLGGVGFGAFIDELGKFITRDNNYFYRPTAALIYIIFILIYLLTRNLLRKRGFSEAEYLANALELMKEAAYQELDTEEKRQALQYLAKVHRQHQLATPLRQLLEKTESHAMMEPSLVLRTRRYARQQYEYLVAKPWFPRALSWVFFGLALTTLFKIAGITYLFTVGLPSTDQNVLRFLVGGDVSVISVASLASSIASGLLIIAGLYKLRTSRYRAYGLWDRALLISIFFTQVFEFASDQFSAAFGLGIDLFLLLSLRYMIAQERRLEHKTP